MIHFEETHYSKDSARFLCAFEFNQYSRVVAHGKICRYETGAVIPIERQYIVCGPITYTIDGNILEDMPGLARQPFTDMLVNEFESWRAKGDA